MRVAWCDGCNKAKVGVVECGEKWERGQFCIDCLREMRENYERHSDMWWMINELEDLVEEV